MFLDQFNRKYWNPVFRGLTHDPDGRHYFRMKHAVWLYLYLLIEANYRTGRVVTSIEKIRQDTGIETNLLCSFLGHLKQWNYVSTEKQNGHILFKISKWKTVPEFDDFLSNGNKKANDAAKKPKTSRKPAKPAKPNPLAQEIVQSFQDKDNLSFYEQVCSQYSEDLIRRILQKVQEIPDEKIKKSRGALFTYLIKQYDPKKQNNNKSKNSGH